MDTSAAEDDRRAAFEAFLYDSPTGTIEFEYRLPAGRLIAVGICDLTPRSLSSVYFFFDPDESRRRGLGTYGALHEIAFAREVADRALFIDEGVIVEDGPAREVLTAPSAERTRLFLDRVLRPH